MRASIRDFFSTMFLSPRSRQINSGACLRDEHVVPTTNVSISVPCVSTHPFISSSLSSCCRRNFCFTQPAVYVLGGTPPSIFFLYLSIAYAPFSIFFYWKRVPVALPDVPPSLPPSYTYSLACLLVCLLACQPAAVFKTFCLLQTPLSYIVFFAFLSRKKGCLQTPISFFFFHLQGDLSYRLHHHPVAAACHHNDPSGSCWFFGGRGGTIRKRYLNWMCRRNMVWHGVVYIHANSLMSVHASRLTPHAWRITPQNHACVISWV